MDEQELLELSEYEEPLKRFTKDVNIRRIKTLDEFQNKVQTWSGLEKKTSANKLAKRFLNLLKPVERERVRRGVPVEEIIPRVMKVRKPWTDREVKILLQERKKRGYGQRTAIRLGRTLRSVYLKSWRTK